MNLFVVQVCLLFVCCSSVLPRREDTWLSQIVRSVINRRKRTDESFCADGFILSHSTFHLKHREGSERNGVRQLTTCASLLSKFHQLINCSETRVIRQLKRVQAKKQAQETVCEEEKIKSIFATSFFCAHLFSTQ